MSKSFQTFFIFLLLLVTSGVANAQVNGKNPIQQIDLDSNLLISTGGPDEYGYLWDDEVSYNWKDPAGATNVTFSNLDNSYAGPFNIGFNFPFYENEYSQLYISTNGVITFGSGGSYASNREIPNAILPNDLIAPFWDNLYVAGSVSYMTGSDGDGQYFAINFVNVTHEGDSLTFQVILYTNGDIWFQYNDLNGDISSAVVGIEDGDGLDGLSYSNLLEIGRAIRFTHPGEIARVKNIPQYASQLAQFGQYNFILNIRNTGEIGADVYDLSASFVPGGGNSGWSVSFWDLNESQNLVPLSDTDIDGKPDTGSVLEGQTISVTVRLEAPSGGAVGDYTTFDVLSTSSLDTSKTSRTTFQSAIPARHFLAFGNSAGLDLGRIGADERDYFDVTSFGDNPALIRNGAEYFYFWEYDDFNPGTDIEFSILGSSGTVVKPITKLTDNTSVSPQTFDLAPYIAVAPDGNVGVIWVRRIFDPGPPLLGENYNIYFAILDRQGNILLPPTNVTNNVDWQDGDNVDVPTFFSPTIMATKDNRFILGWIDNRILPSGSTTDIGFVLYDSDGNQFFPPDDLKNGFADGEQFGAPKFVELSGNRMFVVYSVQVTPTSSQYVPAYEVFSIAPETLGDDLQEEAIIEGTNGRNLGVIEFGNGRFLVAWTNPTSGQIQYAIFIDDGSLITLVPGSITSLSTPDGRAGDFVSMTVSLEGDGIICWVENEASSGTHIYYALVDQAGIGISPPVFSWLDNERVVFSRSGQSVASVPNYTSYLPLISRK